MDTHDNSTLVDGQSSLSPESERHVVYGMAMDLIRQDLLKMEQRVKEARAETRRVHADYEQRIKEGKAENERLLAECQRLRNENARLMKQQQESNGVSG